VSSTHTNAHARRSTHMDANTPARTNAWTRDAGTRTPITQTDARAHKRAHAWAERRAGRTHLYNSIGRCIYKISRRGEGDPDEGPKCARYVRACVRPRASFANGGTRLSFPLGESRKLCAARTCVDPSVPQSTPHHHLSQTEYPPRILRGPSEYPPSPLRVPCEYPPSALRVPSEYPPSTLRVPR
jgi:hypothetical protein